MWSKVKLIQNKVIDLSSIIRPTIKSKTTRPNSSSFDKTRSYFESELFNDVALQELHQINSTEMKLITNFRCTSLELTNHGILIATNENFLLFGRKSFKSDSFRKIQIDSNQNIRVNCMVSLNMDDDIVLLSLSDGRVKTICCNQNIDKFDETFGNSDIEDGSTSSVSSLTATTHHTALPINSFDLAAASTSNGSTNFTTAIQSNGSTLSDNNSLLVGKSCAIQNLVQNERKIYDEMQALNHLDNNEYKVALENTTVKLMNRSAKTINLVNDLTILSNSIDLFVSTSSSSQQYLVVLMKCRKLVALQKNQLTIYDLLSNETHKCSSDKLNENRLIDATTTIGGYNEEYLVGFYFKYFVVLAHQVNQFVFY